MIFGNNHNKNSDQREYDLRKVLAIVRRNNNKLIDANNQLNMKLVTIKKILEDEKYTNIKNGRYKQLHDIEKIVKE